MATPPGTGGIGIIRMSGNLSHGIGRAIFQPRTARPHFQTHRLYLGTLLDPVSGHPLDEVLLTFMKAPHTYTGEDVVEIHSHSGHVLLERILHLLLKQGVRLARPGEFTLRAFLNGKMDLTRAEAIADLIQARSEKGLHLAARQVQGAFQNEIHVLRQRAIDLLAQAEAAIDFPEEVTGEALEEQGQTVLEQGLIQPLEGLLKARGERVWVDGALAVIIGRVNVGKSSLLNALLQEERAIVTPIPGTTRDVIESSMLVQGIPLRLMDTAGLRESADPVEQVGINLARKKITESDLLLVVLDRSRPFSQEDDLSLKQAKGKKGIIVLNKMDLPSRLEAPSFLKVRSPFPLVEVSALTGEGLDRLRATMAHSILEDQSEGPSTRVAPNLRHCQALEQALGHFRGAKTGMDAGMPLEIVALELKNGLDALGEITGETASEAVLDRIFSRFCLGK